MVGEMQGLSLMVLAQKALKQKAPLQQRISFKDEVVPPHLPQTY